VFNPVSICQQPCALVRPHDSGLPESRAVQLALNERLTPTGASCRDREGKVKTFLVNVQASQSGAVIPWTRPLAQLVVFAVDRCDNRLGIPSTASLRDQQIKEPGTCAWGYRVRENGTPAFIRQVRGHPAPARDRRGAVRRAEHIIRTSVASP
jgi:hypothetical protein